MRKLIKKKAEFYRGNVSEIVAKGLVPIKIHCVYTGTASQLNISVFHESMPRGTEVPDIVHSRTNELVYIIRGKVAGFLNGKKTMLKKGDYLVIPAGTNHRLKTGKQGMEALSVFAPPMDPANPDATVVPKRRVS